MGGQKLGRLWLVLFSLFFSFPWRNEKFMPLAAQVEKKVFISFCVCVCVLLLGSHKTVWRNENESSRGIKKERSLENGQI